ncbi:MAG: helix-turn-helix transcriptional regulator [Clostridiales bacterium]|nr:helix-turn-helix transcriptional regulator [Clostridiales bacterium]
MRTAADMEDNFTEDDQPQDIELQNLMPLMSCSFLPGHCLEAVRAIEDGRLRDIAMGEYYYFRGYPRETIRLTEPYLEDADLIRRMSACFVYAFACLSISGDNVRRTRQMLEKLREDFNDLNRMNQSSPRLRAASSFGACFISVLFHLPLKKEFYFDSENLLLFSPGLRSFICYIQAHAAYLHGDYGRSIGIVQTALALQPETCPIPMIYLHVAAAMDYIGLKDTKEAKAQIRMAWELARPDGLVEIFGEHHRLLGGLLEAELKRDWPQDFKNIIGIARCFSRSWRQIHCAVTGSMAPDNLTTTEFSIALLAAFGWTNQEICDHMGLKINTVKWYISIILNKLNIQKRSDLREYILY